MNSLGKVAEARAGDYLIKKGYTLLDVNYKTRFGEIDLIANNNTYIIFCEVKMRDKSSIASPREFVDKSKQNKIIACAKMYLSVNPTNLQPRFDVIEVICHNNRIKSVKHLENAFTL